MDDDYFLKSLRIGDNKGISEIYKTLFPKLKSYILKRNGDQEEAKDIMQKALLQLSARAQDQNFVISSSFDAYFITICKNLWIREVKRRKKKVTNDNIIALTNDDIEIANSAYEQEKWEIFQEKLNLISENCRELLKLFFNKVSYKNIALLKGYATENTVKQRMFKCKAKLKEAIHSDVRYKNLKNY